jgi:hypothetical protein
MHETLPHHSYSVSAEKHNRSKVSSWSIDNPNPCDAKVTVVDEWHLSNGDLETREQTIITFNLEDVDPHSVGAHVQPPPWDKRRQDIEVFAETTDERPRISCNSSEKMKDGTDFCVFDVSEFRLSFTFESFDSDYAKRFAKALGHAVELCGGKPSAF